MVVSNISERPILPGVPTPKHLDVQNEKKILPGVPTPKHLETRSDKDILPGVPTPRHLDTQSKKDILPGVPTPKPLLPGVPTPFLYNATSKGVIENGEKLLDVLLRLDKTVHPPVLPEGMTGGPGTVHPKSFKAALQELSTYFHERGSVGDNGGAASTSVALGIREMLDEFLPIYEEHIGRGIHFPEGSRLEVRYEDSNGNEISKEAFEAISARFESALEKAIALFTSSASAPRLMKV